VRRIGQKASTIRSIWIAGFSIDDSLDSLLQKKDKISQTVIEGNSIVVVEVYVSVMSIDSSFTNIDILVNQS
jgi:hypothetical protein